MRVPRLIRPPTPEQWAAAAAETLRENDLPAHLRPRLGDGSCAVNIAPTEGVGGAVIRVWSSLKVAASGPQAARDPVLEVLHGAGYLDGYRPGATGGMRATMPPVLEDAPAEPEAVTVDVPLGVGLLVAEGFGADGERAAVLRFLKHELARFERARAEAVKTGDTRAGKLAAWASLTSTYIAQISRGDHLQTPEDETP